MSYITPNASVSGSKLETDISLPDAATIDTNPIIGLIASSGTFEIVMGTVTTSGSITVGTGFTVNKVGTGAFEISYSNNFKSGTTPVIVASCNDTSNEIIASVSSSNGSGFTMNTAQGGTPTDSAFSFIAIGQNN